MSTVCSWDLVFVVFHPLPRERENEKFLPITPQVFALTRITHNNDSMEVSCMFQSCAPAPNNAKGREAQAPARPEDEDCGEKKAHRGRIDLSPGKRDAFPQSKN